MNPKKPAKDYIHKAIPKDGKFVGQFAIPGYVPELVRQYGRVLEFDTPEEADAAACTAIVRVLENRPMSKSKPERYARMSPGEFSQALNDLNVTATFFAYLYGTSEHRIMTWLDGSMEIPHPARVLIELMKTDEKLIDLAENVTDKVATRREDRWMKRPTSQNG